MSSKTRSLGLSLIELIFFIVILAIGFSATFLLYTQATRGSVDPVVRKQVLAIATSVLEEIELRGFTYCDPDDANVYTASSATVGPNGCAATVETIGPEAGETSRTKFDNVNDYDGFQMLTGIQDITGTSVPGLSGYQLTNVTITNVTVTSTGASLALAEASDALLISVTVTGPADVSITLHGYRFRYAPNSP
jgi:MSHA pilin protein MshD